MKTREETQGDLPAAGGGPPEKIGGSEQVSHGREEEEPKRAADAAPSLGRFPEENPNPVMRVSSIGELLYANRPAIVMLEAMGWRKGSSLPEVLPRSIRQALGKDTAQGFELLCARNRVFSFALSANREDGHINLYALDITALKRAEEALRKTNDELEARVQERTDELRRANQLLMASEKERRHLSFQLLKAQEEERRKIAVDVHDSLGSCLAATKYTLEKIPPQFGKEEQIRTIWQETVDSMQRCVEECRRIQTALRPPMLDDLGLLATVGWVCREYEKTYPVRIEQQLAIREDEIQDHLKIVIYRILQEALHNIAKHSQANLVRLSLRKAEAALQVAIQDNGQGFDLEKSFSGTAPNRGLGLSSMRERAELSGGSLAIESAVGKGTIIRASWRLSEDR